MQLKTYLLLFVSILLFNSCKKDPVTKPVEFTSTTYKSLGNYDSEGTPDYLLKDTISPALLSFINTSLPDGQNLTKSHPELFSSSAIADITITNPSDVYITFVSQGAAQTNAIAFYTYPTGQSPTSAKDIDTIIYIFPSSGHLTPLQSGDKAKIGSFYPGTSIGFVLMQNGCDSVAHKLDNNVVHFCTNDALNPEVDPNLKKHAVLIDYAPEKKVLIGFEDFDITNPKCDNDFNDVVIYCTVVPV